jgi:hypothetical protein
MRHLNHNERVVADSDVYTSHTSVENRATFVRLFSDRIVPEDGTLTLDEWHLLSMKVPVPQ